MRVAAVIAWRPGARGVLENGLIHFFRSPAGETYADISATERPGLTPIAALPGTAVDLAGLLPESSS